MQGDVVVQRGVNAARTQAVRNGPQAKLPERRAGRKAEQRRRRHAHADGRDLAGAKARREGVAGKAGNDRAGGDDHGHAARPGQACAQALVHAGPGRAQQGIRQTQADKGQINYG